MGLQIYGDNAQGWHGNYEHDDGSNLEISTCPFCDSTDVAPHNTHSPAYRVECGNCHAEGPDGYPHDFDFSGIKDRTECKRLHTEALLNAVSNWNKRHKT